MISMTLRAVNQSDEREHLFHRTARRRVRMDIFAVRAFMRRAVLRNQLHVYAACRLDQRDSGE